MEVYRVVSELGLTLIPILTPTVGAEIGRHNATGVPHCHLWPLLDGAIANMKLGGLRLTGSKALRITGCGAICIQGEWGTVCMVNHYLGFTLVRRRASLSFCLEDSLACGFSNGVLRSGFPQYPIGFPKQPHFLDHSQP